MFDYSLLRIIAEIEYASVVTSSEVIDDRKLRIFLIDKSYIDVFYTPSTEKSVKYAYHWERTFLDGTIYRHDNIPGYEWSEMKLFP